MHAVALINCHHWLHLVTPFTILVGAPGVVVIQEWWGIDHEILVHAALVASHGFHAVVPDLYRGKLGVTTEEAHHLMSALDFPGALKDIAATAVRRQLPRALYIL